MKTRLTAADQRWFATARAEDGFWWLDTSAIPNDIKNIERFVDFVWSIGDVGPPYVRYRLTHAGERLLGLKPAPIPIQPFDRPAGWKTPPVNPLIEHAERWAATARRADGPFTREIAMLLGYDPADIAAHFDRPEQPALPPQEALAELARWAVEERAAILDADQAIRLVGNSGGRMIMIMIFEH